MPINEIRAITMLAKAVELGSIRRAAVAQGVSSQAASQALAQLEQHLAYQRRPPGSAGEAVEV